jgi:hypothetical protein
MCAIVGLSSRPCRYAMRCAVPCCLDSTFCGWAGSELAVVVESGDLASRRLVSAVIGRHHHLARRPPSPLVCYLYA